MTRRTQYFAAIRCNQDGKVVEGLWSNAIIFNDYDKAIRYAEAFNTVTAANNDKLIVVCATKAIGVR